MDAIWAWERRKPFSLDVCETVKQQRGEGVTRILAFTSVVRFDSLALNGFFIRRKYPAIPLTLT